MIRHKDFRWILLGVAVMYLSSLTLAIPSTECIARDETTNEPTYRYYNHEETMDYITCIANNYPDRAHPYIIGESVQGRELAVLALAGTSPDSHVLLRPEIKYVGNMHGDETTGRMLLQYLIDYFVAGYGVEDRVTNLLDNARVHILISMNPDGFERVFPFNETVLDITDRCRGHQIPELNGRGNHNGYDLNRNFPDYFDPNHDDPIQPETQAILDWIDSIQFVLSANFHGGAEVASYGYDSYPGAVNYATAYYSKSPDDEVLRYLALSYSIPHPILRTEISCNNVSYIPPNYGSDFFRFGIINGAEWYPIIGGMQDQNYIRGCLEITLEVSCCKMPLEEDLEGHWNENMESLLRYLESSQMGVKGIVTDAETGEAIEGALVEISDSGHPPKTTDLGEYWRLLLNYNHTIRVSADGYTTHEEEFRVGKVGEVTRLDIELTPCDPCDEGNSAQRAGFLPYVILGALLFNIIKYV